MLLLFTPEQKGEGSNPAVDWLCVSTRDEHIHTCQEDMFYILVDINSFCILNENIKNLNDEQFCLLSLSSETVAT